MQFSLRTVLTPPHCGPWRYAWAAVSSNWLWGLFDEAWLLHLCFWDFPVAVKTLLGASSQKQLPCLFLSQGLLLGPPIWFPCLVWEMPLASKTSRDPPALGLVTDEDFPVSVKPAHMSVTLRFSGWGVLLIFWIRKCSSLKMQCPPQTHLQSWEKEGIFLAQCGFSAFQGSSWY